MKKKFLIFFYYITLLIVHVEMVKITTNSKNKTNIFISKIRRIYNNNAGYTRIYVYLFSQVINRS